MMMLIGSHVLYIGEQRKASLATILQSIVVVDCSEGCKMNTRMHSMWKRFLFLCLTTAYMFVVRCTGWFEYGAAAQYVKKVSRKRKSKLTQTPVTASLSSSLISPNALSAPSPDGSIPPPPYDLSRHC